MGQDEKALIRLWQEKRAEVGPEHLSANDLDGSGTSATAMFLGAVVAASMIPRRPWS